MSNEITVGLSLKAKKSNLNLSKSVNLQKADMNGTDFSSITQSIPTTSTGTAVTIAAGVTTPGWCWFRNLDDTNYVSIGRQVGGTFYALCKLLAGEACLLRLGCASNEVYAVANTSAVILETTVVEE